MSRSYSRLHYGLRPAKNIERKLIVEALSRLDHVYPLRNFLYVGPGSLYLVDFTLFHRRQGFTEMVLRSGPRLARRTGVGAGVERAQASEQVELGPEVLGGESGR